MHKLFISYYHKDDQRYRDYFESRFRHLFISKSVQPGDICSDVSTEYIKHLIQDDYLDDASVIGVLIGPNTRGRKHVDWEISAALNKKVGGYSGLFGILLPTFPLLGNGNYRYEDIPPRLADNVKSGFAAVYTWTSLCSDPLSVKNAIQLAFDSRINKEKLIDNSRLQMQKNTTS
jgi:MTH538 TIR-like domain (DUF1863)